MLGSVKQQCIIFACVENAQLKGSWPVEWTKRGDTVKLDIGGMHGDITVLAMHTGHYQAVQAAVLVMPDSCKANAVFDLHGLLRSWPIPSCDVM